MTDILQHGNWSGLGPNNRFVRLDNIFSKFCFQWIFLSALRCGQQLHKHEALFSHQEISPCVSGVRFAVHEVQK